MTERRAEKKSSVNVMATSRIPFSPPVITNVMVIRPGEKFNGALARFPGAP